MNFSKCRQRAKKRKWDGPGISTGDQQITEEKGENYLFQGIALGHLLDELVVGLPLVRLWSYSETKIAIWVCMDVSVYDRQ